MTETERSGLLSQRTASPIEPVSNGKLDVKDVGEEGEDTDGDSRKEKKTFSSGAGLVLSCLGSVVGTGNIWRYPRIVALHAGGGGALVFLIVWSCFLWIWSIPLILIEYATGRYFRKGTVESAYNLAGPSFRFMGAWMVVVSNAIGCYYSVLLGYCLYYFIYHVFNDLPHNLEQSFDNWYYMHNNTWPVPCHAVSVLVAAVSVSRGVSSIEPMNTIVVPTLLLIILFSFYWGLFLPYAYIGITHFFTPNWSSFGDTNMWLDAITQNAWDTGAAQGAFLTYSTYMTRKNGVVRVGTLTPLCNNFVSLLCGILVFSCVFSVLTQDGYSSDRILEIIQDNGPANTGLTFIWYARINRIAGMFDEVNRQIRNVTRVGTGYFMIRMPLLYNNINGGRFLCALFFLCLTLAGISSLVSILEIAVHALNDFGIKRIPATILVGTLNFAIGMASALDIDILVNQDSVWGYALLLNGLFLVFMIYRFGGEKLRREAVNEYGIDDWKLPRVWLPVIYVITPLLAVGIIGWYIVNEIINNDEEKWYKYSRASLIMVLTQWIIAILIIVGLNWWMKPIHYHPHDPNSTFTRILSFFVRLDAKRPSGYRQPQVISPEMLSEDDTEGTTEFYQLTRSDVANYDARKTPSEEEEVEL